MTDNNSNNRINGEYGRTAGGPGSGAKRDPWAEPPRQRVVPGRSKAFREKAAMEAALAKQQADKDAELVKQQAVRDAAPARQAVRDAATVRQAEDSGERKSPAPQAQKTFVAGAALLGVAGLLVKMLGAVFRIPLTNIIGANGIGYYQVAYPIYVLFLTVSTSGLPTAISRMVAERRTVGQYYEAYRVFITSIKVMLVLGVVTASVLFFGAPLICKWQMEPDAIYAMRATAPALILCPLIASFRGFFQGQNNMGPTAVTQVVDQLFRVGLGLSAAYLLFKIDAPHAAAGASFGATAGGLFGFIAIYIVYIKSKSRVNAEIELSGRKPIQKESGIVKDLFTIAIPITIGACIMPILNWIDTLIVKRRLMAIGYTSDIARTLFGELTGMAAPIINFPQVFTQAVCMSIVPVITNAFKRGDSDFVRKNTVLGLRYAFTIGMPCAFGIMVLAEPIMLLLYPRQAESAVNAAGCLRIYAIGLIFLAATQALSGVLQGIGKQTIPVINLFAGAVVKFAVTFLLTGIPALNVKGAALGTVSAYLVSALLNLRAVKKYTGTKPGMGLALKPLISSVIMAAVVFVSFRFLHGHFGNLISTGVSVALGVIVYVIMVFASKTITAEDLAGVPKMAKLARVLKKIRLLR